MLLVSASVVGMLLLVWLAGRALDRLHVAERAMTLPALTASRLAPRLGIAASGRRAALLEARATLHRYARASGAELVSESWQPMNALPLQLRVAIRVRGSQAQVLGFANAIERDPRQLRFERWRLEGDGIDVRLDAVLLGVSRPR